MTVSGPLTGPGHYREAELLAEAARECVDGLPLNHPNGKPVLDADAATYAALAQVHATLAAVTEPTSMATTDQGDVALTGLRRMVLHARDQVRQHRGGGASSQLYAACVLATEVLTLVADCIPDGAGGQQTAQDEAPSAVDLEEIAGECQPPVAWETVAHVVKASYAAGWVLVRQRGPL